MRLMRFLRCHIIYRLLTQLFQCWSLRCCDYLGFDPKPDVLRWIERKERRVKGVDQRGHRDVTGHQTDDG